MEIAGFLLLYPVIALTHFSQTFPSTVLWGLCLPILFLQSKGKKLHLRLLRQGDPARSLKTRPSPSGIFFFLLAT